MGKYFLKRLSLLEAQQPGTCTAVLLHGID